MEEILNNWLQEKPKDKFDKELHKYTYYDLMEFAEHYHTLQLQQTGVMQRYFHPFVGAGTLIKETEKSLVIKVDFNGKEYFAPKHEFTELL